MTIATCQEKLLNFDYIIYRNTKEIISDQRLFSLIEQGECRICNDAIGTGLLKNKLPTSFPQLC